MYPVDLIEGDLRLREGTEADLDGVLQLLTDPANTAYVFGPISSTLARQRFAYFLASQQAENRREYALVKELSGVGFIGFSRLTIDIGGRSGSLFGANLPEYQGQGHSTAALRLLQHLGFDLLNLDRLWMTVHQDNPAGHALATSAGFARNDLLSTPMFSVYEKEAT